MRKTLVWTGDVIGSFCGAFVVYAVIGTLAARAIAAPWEERKTCWPIKTEFAIFVDCDNLIAQALWQVVVLPHHILSLPAWAARHVVWRIHPEWFSTDNYVVVAYWAATLAPAVVILLSVAGLVYWFDRTRLFAWLLAVGLVGEIATIAMFG
jgi:hypothetical protein